MKNLLARLKAAVGRPKGFSDSAYGKRPAQAGPREHLDITLSPVTKTDSSKKVMK